MYPFLGKTIINKIKSYPEDDVARGPPWWVPDPHFSAYRLFPLVKEK